MLSVVIANILTVVMVACLVLLFDNEWSRHATHIGDTGRLYCLAECIITYAFSIVIMWLGYTPMQEILYGATGFCICLSIIATARLFLLISEFIFKTHTIIVNGGLSVVTLYGNYGTLSVTLPSCTFKFADLYGKDLYTLNNMRSDVMITFYRTTGRIHSIKEVYDNVSESV